MTDRYVLVLVDIGTVLGFLRWFLLFLLLVVTYLFINRRQYVDSKTWLVISLITIIAAPFLILDLIKFPPCDGQDTAYIPDTSENSTDDKLPEEKPGDEQESDSNKDNGSNPSSSEKKSEDKSKTPEEPKETKFEIKTDNAEILKPSSSGKYSSGSEIKITADEKPGYHLEKWESDEESLNGSTDNPLVFLMPSKNIRLHPVYAANTDTPYKVIHKQENIDDDKFTKKDIEEKTGTTGTNVTPETKSYEGFNSPETKTEKIAGDGSTEIVYEYTRKKYTIRFLNYDGKELQKTDVKYEKTPEYTGKTPEKPSTAEYTYTFDGWDEELAPASKEKTYLATYKKTRNKYTVKFINYDGTVLQSEKLEYGSMPSYNGETPEKPATTEYIYTFDGWDEEIGLVTEDKTYTATYSKTKNKYTVKFVNYNGEELQSSLIEYGVTPEYSSATPTKPATAQYTYTFSGWNPEISAVTGDATYTATFSKTTNKYIIKFVNDDGTVLQSSEVEYGGNPSYTGDTPTKAATAQYTYTFNGWSPEISSVSGDQTYTATYSSIVNKYEIKFVNEDGAELQVSNVPYGETPSYDGETPTRAADTQYTYTFNGWTPGLTTVTEAATYTATYSTTTNQYTIRFVNDDGVELQSSDVAYGETPSYSGETPTKLATAQYTYIFSGWSPEVSSVTGAATYTATFSSTVNEYEIKFVNEDGTELQVSNVAYGETPSYDGETPTKAATAQYTYTFAGWTPAITSVTGNATYEATYNNTTNSYLIRFVNDDGTELQSGMVEYGITPVYSGSTPTKQATAQYTYTFDGWNETIVSVTEAKTYTATYSSTVNEYTIKFENYDGTVLQSDVLEYGSMPAYNGQTPAKPSDNYNSYLFSGWSETISTVDGDKTYTAQFSATPIDYTITFKNEDGSIYDTQKYQYEQVINPPANNPSKQYYTFDGWFTAENVKLENGDIVTGDITYIAKFSPTLVCTIATELQAMPCSTDPNASNNRGCYDSGYAIGEKITYGRPFGEIAPQHGSAYDCDINGNGQIDYLLDENNDPVLDANDNKISDERFYYLNETDSGYSALVYYKLINTAQGAISQNSAFNLLPTSSTAGWTNTLLRDFNIDINTEPPTSVNTVTRFVKKSELDSSCSVNGAGSACRAYLKGEGKFLLQNTAFDNKNLIDAIWLQDKGSGTETPPKDWRIHTGAVSVITGMKCGSKPVIEVPTEFIQTTDDLPPRTVSFDSMGGSVVADIEVENGKSLNTVTGNNLPEPTKSGYEFFGWYTDTDFYTEVYPETAVYADTTYYARWIENSSTLPIVFSEKNACEFNDENPITGDYCSYANGVRNYIDTTVQLFTDENQGGNAKKDFEIGFTIVSFEYTKNDRDTLVNSKLERPNDYPGLVMRQQQTNFQITGKFDNIQTICDTQPNNCLIPYAKLKRVKIERNNGILYFTFNDGERQQLADIRSFAQRFDTSVWFGAYPYDTSASSAQRLLTGTLTDMYIKLGTEDSVYATNSLESASSDSESSEDSLNNLDKPYTDDNEQNNDSSTNGQTEPLGVKTETIPSQDSNDNSVVLVASLASVALGSVGIVSAILNKKKSEEE